MAPRPPPLYTAGMRPSFNTTGPCVAGEHRPGSVFDLNSHAVLERPRHFDLNSHAVLDRPRHFDLNPHAVLDRPRHFDLEPIEPPTPQSEVQS
jgi:hypothetical protein